MSGGLELYLKLAGAVLASPAGIWIGLGTPPDPAEGQGRGGGARGRSRAGGEAGRTPAAGLGPARVGRPRRAPN
jgi:hypothetical protein